MNISFLQRADLLPLPVGAKRWPAQFTVPLALLLWYLLSCIKFPKAYERLIIFRLGRLHKIAGPGPVMVFYPFDYTKTIDLNQEIPEWRTLGTRGLEERIKQLVLEGK